MVSYWRLDETSGTTAADSYDGNDGTASGGSWVSAHINNGYEFDGSGDHIDLGTFDVTGSALTIQGWFNADDFDGDMRIFSKADGTAEQDHWFMISERNNGGSWTWETKRKELERQLRKLGWRFVRHGGRHDIWTDGEHEVVVPRHSEINEYTARGILRFAKGEP